MAGRHAKMPKPTSPRHPRAAIAMSSFLNTVPPGAHQAHPPSTSWGFAMRIKTAKELQIDAKRTAPRRAGLAAARLLREGEATQVDSDHQQVAHRLEIGAANVGAPPGGHLDTLRFDDLVHVLRSWERAGD